MAGTELKLDDDYILSMANLFEEWSNDLQDGINRYVGILESILEDSIMEGDTAEALKSFAGYAEQLKGVVATMGKEAKGMCYNFLVEVDKADDYLY